MIKVSIITTFYNARTYIIRSLNSVLNQKIEDPNIQIEYILINDHTPDDCVELIRKTINDVKSQIPNYFDIILLTTPENLGCGGARKFGIDNSTGDYLMFLDADDYYLNSDFVERAVHTALSTESDIVEYGMLYHTTDGKQKSYTIDKQVSITNPHKALVALFKLNAIKFHVWSKIISKNIAKMYDYSTERQYEDVLTIPVWLSLAKKVTIMPTVEINYRAAENSIIRENIIQTRLKTCRAILSHFERFKNDREVLISMYIRAYIDLSALLENKTSDDPGFNEMSEMNTKMLSYIYPNTYKDLTYNLPTNGES